MNKDFSFKKTYFNIVTIKVQIYGEQHLDKEDIAEPQNNAEQLRSLLI